MLCKKSLFVIFVLFVVYFFCCPCFGKEEVFQQVSSDDVPKKLAELANITRENYEKIKTWRGKMDCHLVRVYQGIDKTEHELKQNTDVKLSSWPKQLEKISDAKIEFEIDLTKNLYFKHFDRGAPLFFDPASDKSYPSRSGRLERKKIITSDYQIDVYPNRRGKDGDTIGRIGKKQLAKPYQEQSDPRGFFNVGRPTWELLSELSQALTDPSFIKGFNYKVAIEKNITAENTAYRIRLANPDPGRGLFMTFVLRSEAGFNPTYAEYSRSDGGFVLTKATTDFVNIQGVFMPKSRSVLNFDPADGKLIRLSEYDIVEMQVNAGISEDAFSVNKCGLFDGDIFEDKIKNKKYRYDKNAKCLIDKDDGKKYKHNIAGNFVEVTEKGGKD